MRILGIDPGLNLTGYGCLDVDEASREPILVEAGVFRLSTGASIPDRLRQLADDLSGVLDELAPDRMVVEQIFSHYRHARTAIVMGHARGVVLLAGAQRSLTIDELTPAEVKKAITGRGNATKRQVQHAVMAQCSLCALPEPPDVADALAMALCAARRLEGVRGRGVRVEGSGRD